MDFLKTLFEAGPLSYEAFVVAVEAAKLKLVDLNAGGYVSKDKFDAKCGEVTTLTGQLKQRDADIEELKKNSADNADLQQRLTALQGKYDTDTQALKDQIAAAEYDAAVKDFFAPVKFTSDLAKQAAVQAFKSKGLKLDNGKFLGGDDYLKELKEANPGAFEDDSGDGDQKPNFGTPPDPTRKAKPKEYEKMTYSERIAYLKAHPDFKH